MKKLCDRCLINEVDITKRDICIECEIKSGKRVAMKDGENESI